MGLMACVEISAYQKEVLTFRKEKDFYFKNMPDSPIPDTLKPNFNRLAYFPIDEKWILNAKFLPKNDTFNAEIAGLIEFQYQKQIYRLTAFWEDTLKKSILFLPFKDKTCGISTYSGGRYLNINFQENTELKVDFNYAYHPFCAYNPNYICKKVPQENTLDFEVLAGEKLNEDIAPKNTN